MTSTSAIPSVVDCTGKDDEQEAPLYGECGVLLPPDDASDYSDQLFERLIDMKGRRGTHEDDSSSRVSSFNVSKHAIALLRQRDARLKNKKKKEGEEAE